MHPPTSSPPATSRTTPPTVTDSRPSVTGCGAAGSTAIGTIRGREGLNQQYRELGHSPQRTVDEQLILRISPSIITQINCLYVRLLFHHFFFIFFHLCLISRCFNAYDLLRQPAVKKVCLHLVSSVLSKSQQAEHSSSAVTTETLLKGAG